MGGTVFDDFSMSVDFLIARNAEFTPKYKVIFFISSSVLSTSSGCSSLEQAYLPRANDWCSME